MTLISPARGPGAGPRWSEWIGRAFNALLVTGLGVVLGVQYVQPNKRVLSVAAAAIVLGIAWRLAIVSGVGVMILALPFPRGTTFGSTNLALILLLLVIYLLRVSQRELPRPRATPIDAPVIGLVIAYIVSFYNVDPQDIRAALEVFELLLGTMLMYWVVVNCVRNERDLQRVHMFQTTALLLVLVLAVWELNHPGQVLARGWISFENTRGDEFNLKNVRIGSVFYDYELLADFCGLNLLFLVFLFVRARSTLQRAYAGGLLALTLFVLFCTVTRGPLFSLAATLVYLGWIIRRHLRVVPLVITFAAGTAAIAAVNFIVTHFTRSGNLLERMFNTEIVGLVPESRIDPWKDAWARFLQHPLIGSGPLYTFKRGLYFWFWPHDLYLYLANIVGIFGLAFFLGILWMLWRSTRPDVDSLAAGSYTDGYLLIARVQLLFFLIDQIKIEYLRNSIYQYQVWLLFAFWVAADRVRKDRLATATLARAA